MKKIMILGASILQLPAIRKAKEMGLKVIAVDINPDAIGFQEEGVCCEIISTTDEQGVLQAAKEHNIDGIMTLASDMPMRSVALVVSELGLTGITQNTALNATNKAMMRQCLQLYNVPIPEFYRVSTEEEFKKVIEVFEARNMKCIVKPADNSGSRGIELISSLKDVDAINSAFKYSQNYSRSGEILVEEYMEGPEVSVESLSVNGICNIIQVTDKLTTGAPHFVEMGHNEPSMLSEDIKSQILKVAQAAVKAIGIENGPAHTEIKVTSEGPKIVELGARLGGDNITTHLVPLSTGIDMVECCIQIALGENPSLERKFRKGAAIRYIKADTGIITNITGIDSAKNMANIKEIEFVYGVGNESIEVKNSVDRIGYVIAQSDSVEKAIKVCEDAIREIEIKVRKK